MPKKIKFKVNSHEVSSTDDAATDAMATIESSLNSAGAKSSGAEVIRDTNGKVVEVIVGVPDHVADGTVGNAANAVQNNRGVSKIRQLLSDPLEILSITSVTPDLTGKTSDPATGWSWNGFSGIIEYIPIGVALNHGSSGSYTFTPDAWIYGHPLDPSQGLTIKRPVVFMVMNWGDFLNEVPFLGALLPDFVKGDITLSEVTLTVTYNDGIVAGQTKDITIPTTAGRRPCCCCSETGCYRTGDHR